MKYCTSCGKALSDKAKFCPHCGDEQLVPEKAEAQPQEEKQPKPQKPRQDRPAKKFPTLRLSVLEPGQDFNGYHITNVMNKDEEGIKYIAKKDGEQYVLKLFFKSRLVDLSKFNELQLKLNRIREIDNQHIAKVVEISKIHDSAYMVTRFVDGISLDRKKQQNGGKLSEELIRSIAIQLVQATIEIREHGLSIRKLILSGMMLDKEDKLVILSSGIKYEDNEEVEDIFVIGALLAQLLSSHVLYRNLYSTDRLQEVKFQYLNGVSLSMNKVVASCLHRNIIHRVSRLEQVLDALEKLPPIEADEIWDKADGSGMLPETNKPDIPIPGSRIEWGFVALVAVVLIIVALFAFSNLFSIIFRGSEKPFQFTGLIASEYTLMTSHPVTNNRGTITNAPVQTEYGALKSGAYPGQPGSGLSDRYKPLPPTASSWNTPAKASPSQAPMPANMVYVSAGSFGFGRLKDNLNHNVTLNGFYISKYEVTQREWKEFMSPPNSSTVGDNLPVDNISWEDVIRYCNARSRKDNLEEVYKYDYSKKPVRILMNIKANGWRLPTEAEWEMAAKGGALFDYSGSDNPDEVAWTRDNSPGKIHAGYATGEDAKNKKPNGYGLCHMTGNVAEWCWDWYDPAYTRTVQIFIDPTGPDSGSQRVIRGGSVMNGEGRNLNILYREKGSPSRGLKYVGFRLVRTK